MIALLGQSLVLTLTAYGATLTFGIVDDQPWARREVLFPLREWAALLGAVLGASAAISIWYATGFVQRDFSAVRDV